MTNAELGRQHPKEYRSWLAIKGRCYYRGTNRFERYGGRGIRMCARWRRSFAAFLADMGPAPSLDHSAGRIDHDDHYKPGNVRWQTRKEQGAAQPARPRKPIKQPRRPRAMPRLCERPDGRAYVSHPLTGRQINMGQSGTEEANRRCAEWLIAWQRERQEYLGHKPTPSPHAQAVSTQG